jgi:hypothetical protein
LGMWIGFIWLSIGTGGELLGTRWWAFGFHKMRGISWLAERTLSFLRRTLLHGVSAIRFQVEAETKVKEGFKWTDKSAACSVGAGHWINILRASSKQFKLLSLFCF